MDLDRYRTAWANNAIAKQTLDDQEKTVLQDEGTVKADEGQGAIRSSPARLLPHYGARSRAGQGCGLSTLATWCRPTEQIRWW
jgi:hypothetical protein